MRWRWSQYVPRQVLTCAVSSTVIGVGGCWVVMMRWWKEFQGALSQQRQPGVLPNLLALALALPHLCAASFCPSPLWFLVFIRETRRTHFLPKQFPCCAYSIRWRRQHSRLQCSQVAACSGGAAQAENTNIFEHMCFFTQQAAVAWDQALDEDELEDEHSADGHYREEGQIPWKVTTDGESDLHQPLRTIQDTHEAKKGRESWFHCDFVKQAPPYCDARN